MIDKTEGPQQKLAQALEQLYIQNNIITETLLELYGRSAMRAVLKKNIQEMSVSEKIHLAKATIEMLEQLKVDK